MWEGIIIKRKFKRYDYVGFYSEGSDAYEYGMIQDYDKKQKKYEVALCKNWERVFLSDNSLTFMPKKELDYADLKKLMRYEISYRDFVAEARKTIDISFVKVKAHAGNKYNEMADRLAKKALEK